MHCVTVSRASAGMFSMWSARSGEECFSYSHFPDIQSEASSRFKAPPESPTKAKQWLNKSHNGVFSSLSPLPIHADSHTGRARAVCGEYPRLKSAQRWGCLCVVRGTWNRPPCPMSSLVFLLSLGFSMLSERTGLWRRNKYTPRYKAQRGRAAKTILLADKRQSVEPLPYRPEDKAGKRTYKCKYKYSYIFLRNIYVYNFCMVMIMVRRLVFVKCPLSDIVECWPPEFARRWIGKFSHGIWYKCRDTEDV